MATANVTPELLALRLRDARHNFGWTLQQLSEEIGGKLSASQLSRIETNKRDVQMSELLAIVNAYGIDLTAVTRAGQICTTCGQEIPEPRS